MYQFTYFNNIHIMSLSFYILVGILIIILPKIFKGLENTIYTKILGVLFIAMKILDSIFRVYYENENFIEVLPLNLCNIALLIAGIYFITRNNILINIVYFYSLGAVLAIILPGITVYYNPIYPYMFMGSHIFELIALVYAFVYMNVKITKKGLKITVITYIITNIIVKIFNNLMGTNFMYLNDYIIQVVSFIKPIILYDVVLIVLFIISMYIMYIPFKDKNKIKMK